LGEFGYLICDTPEMSAEKQFDVLYKHYVITSSIPTKSLILTAFIKMINLYEEIKPRIVEVLKKSSTNMDLEIQQRACEYLGIQQIGDDIMKKVFEPMPVFPDNRESALLLRLRKQEKNNQNTENADEKENTIRSHSSNSSNNSSSIGGKNHGSAASSPSNEVDDDLLGLDTTLPTQPMSNKNNAGALGGLGGGKADIRGPSPVGDLLDVFGGGVASPPAPMGGVIGIEASLTPKLVEWSKNIMISNSGVLFENDLIQIGVKQEFRGSQGRINLFYGNKGSDNYNNFKVSYEAGPSFRLQAEDMGNCLASRQQLKQQIMIESMGPFTSSPVMKVSFTRNNGASYLYNLKLPATVTSFIEPVPLVRDDFMKRWGALEGQEREQQEVFTAQNKIDMAHNRSILTEKIKFAIAEVH
jgi:AP-2 complex subunit alpha